MGFVYVMRRNEEMGTMILERNERGIYISGKW